MSLDLDRLEREMTAWRRDLDAPPEFGFEETRTSTLVAAKLREFGFDEVAEGISGGVVGTVKRGNGNRGHSASCRHGCAPHQGTGRAELSIADAGHDACAWP